MKYGNTHFSNLLLGERTAEKWLRLKAGLRKEDKLAILMHGEPDPDALSSAWALQELVKGLVGEVKIFALQPVKRQQNLLFARKLRIPFTVVHEVPRGAFTKFALVDAQPDFFQPALPVSFDIILDHHPKRGSYSFKFSDIRPRYGATATIMLEYLVTAQKSVGKRLATALCYGLCTDTDDLVRGVSPQDVAALGILKPKSDAVFLHTLELAEIPRSYTTYFLQVLDVFRLGEQCPVFAFNSVPAPDVCVHIADFLSQFTATKWVAIGGIHGGQLHVILRESRAGADVGMVARRRLAPYGSAGGHKSKSRASIPLETVQAQLGKDITTEALTAWLKGILLPKRSRSRKAAEVNNKKEQ